MERKTKVEKAGSKMAEAGIERVSADIQLQGRKDKMQIEDLKQQLEKGDISFTGNCHDCGQPVEVLCSVNENGKLTISGGAVYNPLILATTGRPERRAIIVKCDRCFREKPRLYNWQDADVYSRIVGYLRPVGGWNKGKQEEFKQRKEFVVEGK